MPIDFAAIADRFRESLGKQTKQMKPVFERLADSVRRLAEQADAAERATRAYPVLRYHGNALSVRVETLGAPLLPAAPPLGFVDSLRTGGREFLAGIGWIRTAVQQEIALPRILGVGLQALGTVLASLERFERPSPGMFDPRERRLSDVFGLLALTYRSLLGAEARAQLLEVAGASGRAMIFYRIYKRLLPDPPEYASMSAVDQWVHTFEGKARDFLDYVLLLPILGELLAVLLHDAALEVKRLVLTELSGLEAKVHALRATAIDGFLKALDLGTVAANWLTAARVVVLLNLEIVAVAAPKYLETLLDGLRGFADGVTAWGMWLTDLLETVRAVVDAFMSFDLLGFALRVMFPGWLIDLLPELPTFTVDDLITMVIGGALSHVRDTINDWFNAALLVLSLPGLGSYYDKVEALKEVFNIVVTPRPFTLPPDVMPRGPLAGFPDVYEAFFGGGRAASFLGGLERLGVEARAGVRGTIQGAATAMIDLGAIFAAEADRAVQLGSAARMRELALGAASMAERVFGPEADRLAGQIAARRPDPLAAAFEAQVASQGFSLVGAAIPAYVGAMRRYWVARRPLVEPPTSPHILARHGRLGAVRVPRMAIRASGHRANRALAGRVAERFREAVGSSYVSGRRDFERMASAPQRGTTSVIAPPRGRSGRGR
jgi:hypothetical protein